MNTEREKKILETLIKEKEVSVKGLAKQLYASEPSIRRDLHRLEQQNLLRRTHGGAVIEENYLSGQKIPFHLRELDQASEKSALARRAADLVEDGAVIFLDASSSAYSMVPFLRGKKDLTFVTCGVKVMTALCEAGFRVISTGGELIPSCMALVGFPAQRTIRSYHADLFFFSARGLNAHGTVSDISVEEDLVRQEMLAAADRSFLLCNSNKYPKQYFHNLCTLSDLSGVICDFPLPPGFENKKK